MCKLRSRETPLRPDENSQVRAVNRAGNASPPRKTEASPPVAPTRPTPWCFTQDMDTCSYKHACAFAAARFAMSRTGDDPDAPQKVASGRTATAVTAALAAVTRNWLLMRSVTRTHREVSVLADEQEAWRLIPGVQISGKCSLICDARDHRSVSWRWAD